MDKNGDALTRGGDVFRVNLVAEKVAPPSSGKGSSGNASAAGASRGSPGSKGVGAAKQPKALFVATAEPKSKGTAKQPTVANNGNGTYTVSYAVVKEGKYQFHVKLGNVVIMDGTSLSA